MVGLRPDPLHFLTAVGIGVLIEQSACAFGTMISCITPNFTVALILAGPILTLLQLTGGLFANVDSIPVYLSWIQWISWFRYGFEAYMVNQWSGIINITCTVEDVGCVRTGEEVIRNLSFDPTWLTLDCGVLVAMIATFYTIGYLGLCIRTYRSR